MHQLWDNHIPGFDPSFSSDIPSVEPFLLPGTQVRGALIVAPGGGYGMRAPHEGKPIAEWANSIGLHAFVLTYRVSPYRHPIPLQDAQRAVRYVRAHAKKFNIDPAKIGILGFSAGGHLCSTVLTHWDNGNTTAADPVEHMSSRPDFGVLCYPVISSAEFRHSGSWANLLGANPDPALLAYLSSETRVAIDTPPTFLWHTADDAAVPVENSLLFAQALSRHKVNHELHVFSRGRHGVGLSTDNPHLAAWTKLCENWLRVSGYIG